MLGIPVLENKKVSWLLGFLAFGFLVSEFLGSLVSKIPKSFIFQKTSVPYQQFCFSCFLIDIAPISKILNVFYTDLHHCSAPVFSTIVKLWELQHFDI